MGTYIKGIHGGTSGKVGNVIGAHWKDIDYWRSLSRKSNKPATQLQLDVRFIFGMVRAFLKPVKGLIKMGYASAKSQTPMNAAIAYTISKGVTGVSPNFIINYEKVKFSTGPLDAPTGTDAMTTDPASVGVTWLPAAVNLGDNKPTDKAVVLIYNPTQNAYVMSDTAAVRSALTASVTVPGYFSGDLVHVWLLFMDAAGKRLSDSVHAGAVTVQ